MESFINSPVIFKKQHGDDEVLILDSGGTYRVVIVYSLDGSLSCERMYNSPEEVREGFKKDWWRVFKMYTPEELIKIMYPVV